MSFEEALEAMKYDGKKVSRDCWKDGTFLYIPSGKKCVMLSKVDSEGIRHAFVVTQLTTSNIMAEDWRVYDAETES